MAVLLTAVLIQTGLVLITHQSFGIPHELLLLLLTSSVGKVWSKVAVVTGDAMEVEVVAAVTAALVKAAAMVVAAMVQAVAVQAESLVVVNATMMAEAKVVVEKAGMMVAV